MSENVENIMLEHLRAMRTQMGRLEEKLDLVSAEMLVMRRDTAGVVGSQTIHEQRFAYFEHRIGRIERRLELVD